MIMTFSLGSMSRGRVTGSCPLPGLLFTSDGHDEFHQLFAYRQTSAPHLCALRHLGRAIARTPRPAGTNLRLRCLSPCLPDELHACRVLRAGANAHAAPGCKFMAFSSKLTRLAGFWLDHFSGKRPFTSVATSISLGGQSALAPGPLPE